MKGSYDFLNGIRAKREIIATFDVQQCGSGFKAIRVPSEFAVNTLLEIILDNHSQTKTHARS